MYWARRGERASSRPRVMHSYVFTHQDDEDETFVETDSEVRGQNLAALRREMLLSERTVLFVGELGGQDSETPREAHMCVAELVKEGRVHRVITTSCSGMLRWAGLPPSKIIELHGNRYEERCCECGARYYREFDVRTKPRHVPVVSYGERQNLTENDVRHLTKRFCERGKQVCRGRLRDDVIREGEDVSVELFEEAMACAQSADLCIVVGTRLHRLPAARIPAFAATNGAGGLGARLVVGCSRRTSLDHATHLRIWETSDRILRDALHLFGLTPPQFFERRQFSITSKYVSDKENSREKFWRILVEAHDECGVPLACMNTVTVKTNGHGEFWIKTLSKQKAMLELYTARKSVGPAEVRVYFAKSTGFPLLLLHHTLDQASEGVGCVRKWNAAIVPTVSDDEKRPGRIRENWKVQLESCNKHRIRKRVRGSSGADAPYDYEFQGYYTDLK